MDPRPILLVADPLNGDIRLHHHTEAVLNREGYLVLRCPPEAMHDFRVLAPCPFTADDVAFLRMQAHVAGDVLAMAERHAAGNIADDFAGDVARLTSLADRIEAML